MKVLAVVALVEELEIAPPVEPSSEPSSEPSEPVETAQVVCHDGTVSTSGGRSGACAWHGGVDWEASGS